jgi:hypothetical protein
MSDNEMRDNNGIKDFLIRVFVTVTASAIVGGGASYIAMRLELGDMERRMAFVENATDPAAKALFAYNSVRIDKTEKSIDELRKAIDELKNNILPQLAEIRAAVLYIKEDISREKKPAGYREGKKE